MISIEYQMKIHESWAWTAFPKVRGKPVGCPSLPENPEKSTF